MKKVFRSFSFWFGILAFFLIFAREFVFTTSHWQNLLPLTNLPLYAVLMWINSNLISPVPCGPKFTQIEILTLWLPYYILFILTYIGYGFIVDFVVKKIKIKAK